MGSHVESFSAYSIAACAVLVIGVPLYRLADWLREREEARRASLANSYDSSPYV